MLPVTKLTFASKIDGGSLLNQSVCESIFSSKGRRSESASAPSNPTKKRAKRKKSPAVGRGNFFSHLEVFMHEHHCQDDDRGRINKHLRSRFHYSNKHLACESCQSRADLLADACYSTKMHSGKHLVSCCCCFLIKSSSSPEPGGGGFLREILLECGR